MHPLGPADGPPLTKNDNPWAPRARLPRFATGGPPGPDRTLRVRRPRPQNRRHPMTDLVVIAATVALFTVTALVARGVEKL